MHLIYDVESINRPFSIHLHRHQHRRIDMHFILSISTFIFFLLYSLRLQPLCSLSIIFRYFSLPPSLAHDSFDYCCLCLKNIIKRVEKTKAREFFFICANVNLMSKHKLIVIMWLLLCVINGCFAIHWTALNEAPRHPLQQLLILCC